MKESLVQRLVEFRRQLHAAPEVSNREASTAKLVRAELAALHPDALLADVGGHGVAAVFESGHPGPTVLVRADLDAVPVSEETSLLVDDYGSRSAGVAHKCGHDGHMAMLTGAIHLLREEPLTRGSVVALYQPAEETGEGAARVIADSRFGSISPDLAIALHNLPGFPLHRVVVRSGVFALASVGMIVSLQGATSHAAEPEQGRSPALAVASLINEITAAPQQMTALADAAKATVIHVRVGERAFGTTPGEAVVMATLRADATTTLDALKRRLSERAHAIAGVYDLACKVEWTEEFHAVHNDPEVTDLAVSAAQELELEVERRSHPFPWSEDFGRFADLCPSALIGLGSGADLPALHQPSFDFPDALIPTGAQLLAQTVRLAVAKMS